MHVHACALTLAAARRPSDSPTHMPAAAATAAYTPGGSSKQGGRDGDESWDLGLSYQELTHVLRLSPLRVVADTGMQQQRTGRSDQLREKPSQRYACRLFCLMSDTFPASGLYQWAV